MRIIVIQFLALSLLSGCASPQANKNEPAAPESNESLPQLLGRQRREIETKINLPIQEATRTEIVKILPTWNVVGWNFERSTDDNRTFGQMFAPSEAIEESLKNRPAIVTADLVDNQGRRKILSFAARSFVNNHNERYWRIELLTPELRQLILKPHKGNSSEGTDD